MKYLTYLIILSFAFGFSFKSSKRQTKEASKVELAKGINHTDDTLFDNVDDFKKFISSCKWVDLENVDPCDPHGQYISFKEGSLYGYDYTEPLIYEVESVDLFDSKTLRFKIKSEVNNNFYVKVKVLNIKEKLVEWDFDYYSYKAKPYNVLCDSFQKTILYKKPKEIIVPKNWIGKYYFEVGESGRTILISEKEMTYEAVAMRYYAKYQLSASLVADTLALFYHKGLSGNEDELEAYSPLFKLYKDGDKYYIKSAVTLNSYETLEIEKY